MENDELYFTTNATESEHGFIQSDLEEECLKLGLTMVYYRKFKRGHVPCYRECKIKGAPVYKIKEALKGAKVKFQNENQKVHLNGQKIPLWLFNTFSESVYEAAHTDIPSPIYKRHSTI